jgi:hypothetical protein
MAKMFAVKGIAAPLIFMLIGGFHCWIGLSSLRARQITIGRRRKRTFTRADRPFDFWGYCFWFILFGGFFFVVGLISLIRDLVG